MTGFSAHCWAIPRDVTNDKLAAVLGRRRFMLGKPAQAMTYDKGRFYRGPAVKDVPLSMAPSESQKLINEYSRPYHRKLIADAPSETPLPADKLAYAFQRWDQRIGSRPGK